MEEIVVSYLNSSFQKEMKDKYGMTVLLTKETGSTNNDLKALAKQGAPSGTVLIAEKQTNGHGQYGRVFESPEGGIYMSMLFRTGLPTEETLQITTLAGIKVQEAVEEVCGVKADIKLPNDLLINGKKICGILTETYTEENGMAIVIGLGIDANTDSQSFPEELRGTAASIKELIGRPVDMQALAGSVINKIISINALHQGV